MTYKNLGIIFTLSLIVTSCGYFITPRNIKQGFTNKFENKYTGIDTLININGYYDIKIPFRRTIYSKGWKLEVERYEHDTIHTKFIFYPNGIYLLGFNDDVSIYNGKAEDIDSYFTSIIYDTIGKVSKGFYTNSTWGSYKINKDTIIAQYIHRPGFGDMSRVWYAYEVWYKVLDRNTIKEINLIPIHKMSDSDWYNWNLTKNKRKFDTASFIPVDTIPKYSSWIIKRKWFWKNNERIK